VNPALRATSLNATRLVCVLRLAAAPARALILVAAWSRILQRTVAAGLSVESSSRRSRSLVRSLVGSRPALWASVESGGEGWPGRVGDDPVGVFGQDGAHLLSMAVGSGRAGGAGSEAGQGHCGGLLVGGAKVGEGLFGGGVLLMVLAGVVPAGDGDDDCDGRAQEPGGRAAIVVGVGAGELPGGVADGVAGLVVGLALSELFSTPSPRRPLPSAVPRSTRPPLSSNAPPAPGAVLVVVITARDQSSLPARCGSVSSTW